MEKNPDPPQLLRAVFDQLDKDGSGSLSLSELSAALRAAGTPTTDAAVAKLASAIDTDSNDGISFDEFEAFYRFRVQQLRAVFVDLDLNDDNQLDSAELRAGLDTLCLKATDNDVRRLMAALDRNRDGVVSFEEFVAVLMMLPANNAKAMFDAVVFNVPVDAAQSEYVLPPDVRSDVVAKLLAGAVAGAVSRSATAPIDRIKTLRQASMGASSSLWLDLKIIFKTEGIRGLFAANGANVVKIAPETAIKFTLFDFFKAMFVAGGAAGATGQAIIYPLEIAKTRFALLPVGTFSSIGNCISAIYRREGFRALYAGLFVSVLGVIPYAGVDLAANSLLKEYIGRVYDAQDREPGVAVVLACGATSSTAAMLATYPLGLLRTRLQASGLPNAQHYTSLADCVQKTWVNGGVRAFYKGLTPNMLKVLPATAISYSCYDWLVNCAKSNRVRVGGTSSARY